MKPQSLEYVINHLFLPPKLPQEYDDDPESSKQRALVQHLADCADLFCDHLRREDVEDRVQACWGVLQTMLSNFANVYEGASLSREHLAATINTMDPDG
jgi:hypothetical protein